MDNYQAHKMMLRLAILGEYDGPVDGKPSSFSPQAEVTAEEPQDCGAAAAQVNSEDSTADKVFMPTPWVKPPRRKPFNESATRGWRREYQREYRADHGNT